MNERAELANNDIRIRTGQAGKIRNHYVSEKNDKEHGLGLGRVDSIVEKYKGFVNRQNEEGVFATEILLSMA